MKQDIFSVLAAIVVAAAFVIFAHPNEPRHGRDEAQLRFAQTAFGPRYTWRMHGLLGGMFFGCIAGFTVKAMRRR